MRAQHSFLTLIVAGLLSSSGLYGQTLNNFLVEAAAGGSIGTQIAGTSFNVKITARDSANNTLTGFTGTAVLTSLTGGLVGSPVTTASFVAGVLTSQSVTLTSAGPNRTITATRSGGSETGTSNTFTLNAGATDHFVISAISSPQTAGTPFTIATITAQDVYNNTATGFAGTALLTSATGGLVGSPVTTASFVAGVLTSQSVTLTSAGPNRTITATRSGGSETGTSNTFTLNAGATDHFVISAISSPQTAGTPFTIATITAQDVYNNTATGFAGTALLTSATGGLVGSPVTTASFVAGVLTSQSVTLTSAGSGRTIVATRTGGTETGTSNSLTVNPGLEKVLIFIVQPTTTAAGAIITPAVTVQLRDDYGNNVSKSGVSVALALTSGTGTLGGTTSRPSDAGGLATFSDLTINVAGANKQLTASGGSLTAGTSSVFTITEGGAVKLTLATQPSATATSGIAFPQQPVVRIEDVNGNLVTSDNTTVVTALRAVGTGSLSGGTSVTAIGGIATFADLSYDVAETISIQFASTPTLTSAISNNVVVGPDVAKSVVFVQQPTNTVAGVIIAPSVTVQLKDSKGNNAPQAGVSIALSLTTGTGTLSGTVTRQTNGQGLATFNDLRIDLTGSKRLTASSLGLTSAISNTFSITSGSGVRLQVHTQPSATATAGVALTQQPVIWVVDAAGNQVTTDNSTVVTAARLAGNGTLQGTLTATAVNGAATFANLSHNVASTISILFSSGSLVPDTSSSIVVSPAAAAQLVFVQQPTGATAGAVITPAVTVKLEDAFGNDVLTTGTSVVIALSSGTGALSGTLSRNTASGLATFNNLSVNLVGSKTLAASSGSLTAATSNAFTVAAGAAKTLAFIQQPTNTAAASTITPAVTVQVRDSLGNDVPASGTSITLGIFSGSGALERDHNQVGKRLRPCDI